MTTHGVMKTLLLVLAIILPTKSNPQTAWKGQASAWGHLVPENPLPCWTGIRYLPQVNAHFYTADSSLIDVEASANLQANLGMDPFSDFDTDASAKAYRLWARYSSNQWELRAGLQKINFGSAVMLRPLMWFDKMDPRDPLQLTDGVWGVLGRYYFLNNANLWLWALWGNKTAKTWETGNTDQSMPEMGGRLQMPIPKGEAALSFHYRKVDALQTFRNSPEQRLGVDAKWDLTVGLWVEACWMHKVQDWGTSTNQTTATVGTDYTFAVGNGLNLVAEQLVAAYGKKMANAQETLYFSAVSASYPIGIFTTLSAMTYLDWRNGQTYNFLTCKRDISKLTLYLMAFYNPRNYQLPLQNSQNNLFAGTGGQVMVVFNY